MSSSRTGSRAASARPAGKPSTSADEELLFAAQKGQIDAARRALDAGADPNARDDRDWSPMFKAAIDGNIDMVHLLFDHGADPAAVQRGGWTPLHKACEYGHLPVVLFFLEEVDPPPPPATDPTSGTAETTSAVVITDEPAAGAGGGAEETGTGDAGDDEAALAATGGTVGVGDVDLAVVEPPPPTFRCPVDPVSFEGRTPLFFAATGAHMQVAMELLQRGADVSVADRQGWTALHAAARAGSPNMAVLLMAWGADEKATGRDGLTAHQCLFKNVEDYWVVVHRRQAYEEAYYHAKKTGAALPDPPRDPYNISWDRLFLLMTNRFLRALVKDYTSPGSLEGVPAASYEKYYMYRRVKVEDVVALLEPPFVKAGKLADQEAYRLKIARRRARGLLIKEDAENTPVVE